MHRSRYNATLIIQFSIRFASEDSMCFTRACLPKCHYDSIEPVEHILYNRLRELCISDSLITLHVEHIVEYVISSVDSRSYERQTL